MASARITPARGAALESLIDGDELAPPRIIGIMLDALDAVRAD